MLWDREWCRNVGFPSDIFVEYRTLYHRETRLGHEFPMSIAEWCAWWMCDNRWARRSTEHGIIRMSRSNPLLPYSIENVFPEFLARAVKSEGDDSPNNAHGAHPEVAAAKVECQRLGRPEAMYQAFRAHWNNAKRRGIPFLFDFEGWSDWWLVDNRWGRRGLHDNGLVMARKNDAGPYSAENVYCTNNAENLRDVQGDAAIKRSAAIKASFAARKDAGVPHHLAVRGSGHPRSKPVMTPKGRFGSARLAAEAFGVSDSYAQLLAKRGEKGWSYAVN